MRRVNIILECIVIITSLLFVECKRTKIMEGQEGDWKTYIYSTTTDEGKKIRNKTDIKVLVTTYQQKSDKIYIKVDWEVRNTDKEPTSYSWNNKCLMDKEGRIYCPYDGKDSKKLQPLETEQIWVAYKVPNAVNIKDLWWGLWHGDNIPDEKYLKYKIRLSPTHGTVIKADDICSAAVVEEMKKYGYTVTCKRSKKGGVYSYYVTVIYQVSFEDFAYAVERAVGKVTMDKECEAKYVDIIFPDAYGRARMFNSDTKTCREIYSGERIHGQGNFWWEITP